MATYEKGRVDVGGGCHAWLQPDGGWGWSNAALVVGDGASLLVDTLFDLPLTREMLDGFGELTAANPIGTLVNTHANGDHCYGNELVAGAEIVATEACAAEMAHTPPEMLAAMVEAGEKGEMGDTGRYFARIFGPFEFRGITLTPPTSTFTGRREVDVAGTTVELLEVGPAHTAGDCIAHVPDARTVFTGDLCFIEGTPIMWAGPISNWIAACDLIVDEQARARHEAGMSLDEAVHDIALGEFAGWIDRERLAVNVDSVYRELDPARGRTDVVTLFGMMASLAV